MTQREVLLLRVVAVLLVVVVAVVWASSYYGRSNLVDSLRAGCERGGKNTVASVNVIRADANANRAVSNDPKQPAATRTARFIEAQIEEKELAGYDTRIVLDVLGLVNDPRDRVAVATAGLRCSVLFPSPSVVSLH